MDPYNPPGIIAYLVAVAGCVAAMLLVHRLVRYPLASCLGSMLALVPAVVSVCYKLRFIHQVHMAGYTGLTALEVIQHRHQISFWSGIISSGALLIGVATIATFISYRRHAVTSLLPVATLLALGGCSHPRHSYEPTDEFFAGGHFDVPSEFRRSTASRADVDAWSCSLLGENPLEFLRFDIDGDRIGELFVSQAAHSGTGGNSYLVFEERRRGFRYLGRLFLGRNSLRPLPRDDHSRPRVLTSSWMGGGECKVTIHVLQSDGFHVASSRVLPCGDSATDGGGGRLHRLLFESATPRHDVLRTVFGGKL